jgi:hypothetical protein
MRRSVAYDVPRYNQSETPPQMSRAPFATTGGQESPAQRSPRKLPSVFAILASAVRPRASRIPRLSRPESPRRAGSGAVVFSRRRPKPRRFARLWGAPRCASRRSGRRSGSGTDGASGAQPSGPPAGADNSGFPLAVAANPNGINEVKIPGLRLPTPGESGEGIMGR